jgi:hypothetical protein
MPTYPYTDVERVPYHVVTARLCRLDLRKAIRCGWSMDFVDRMWRAGHFQDGARNRFERLFAWSTATEHRLTAGVPLDRWRARRERVRRAILRLREGGR